MTVFHRFFGLFFLIGGPMGRNFPSIPCILFPPGSEKFFTGPDKKMAQSTEYGIE
jgi:hypothetical protein